MGQHLMEKPFEDELCVLGKTACWQIQERYRMPEDPHGSSAHHAAKNQAAGEERVGIRASTGRCDVLLGTPVMFNGCLVC